jgi:hypothetical protein
VSLISSCGNRTLLADAAQAVLYADRGFRYPDNSRMPKKDIEKAKYLSEFADRVAEALEKKGIKGSIQDKATAIGVSKSFMDDVLKGRKLPSGWNMVNLATKLGVGAEWLITGKGDMIPVIHEGFVDITILSDHWQEIIKEEVTRVYVLSPDDYKDVTGENQPALAPPAKKKQGKQKALPPPKSRQ